MRRLFILVTLISALLAGCVDGDDGRAFLRFFWIGAPLSYADNNPDTPDTIFLLQDYVVSRGTYSFTYTAFEGSMYAGTYTITVEEGEPGIFPFIPGEDGEDNHFELWLFSTGPSFFEFSTDLEQAAAQSYGINTDGVVTSLKKDKYSDPDLTGASEETVISRTRGRYKLTLRYKKL